MSQRFTQTCTVPVVKVRCGICRVELVPGSQCMRSAAGTFAHVACADMCITPERLDATVSKLGRLLRTAGVLPATDVLRDTLEAELATMSLDPFELAVLRRGLGLTRDA